MAGLGLRVRHTWASQVQVLVPRLVEVSEQGLAGQQVVTLCATCSPPAGCWVPRTCFRQSPERALCGGWLALPSLGSRAHSAVLRVPGLDGLPRAFASTKLLP